MSLSVLVWDWQYKLLWHSVSECTSEKLSLYFCVTISLVFIIAAHLGNKIIFQLSTLALITGHCKFCNVTYTIFNPSAPEISNLPNSSHRLFVLGANLLTSTGWKPRVLGVCQPWSWTSDLLHGHALCERFGGKTIWASKIDNSSYWEQAHHDNSSWLLTRFSWTTSRSKLHK